MTDQEAKWQYHQINAESTTLKGRLDEAGQDGWEAVGMTEDAEGMYTVVLKKPL